MQFGLTVFYECFVYEDSESLRLLFIRPYAYSIGTMVFMRVFCLYRPNTEHERPVIELNGELKRRINMELELISVDTVEGDHLAQVHGVMQFPAVIATDSVGVMQKSWADGSLPLINELSYYLQQT